MAAPGRSLPVVMTLIRSDAGYEQLVGEGGRLAGDRGWLRSRLWPIVLASVGGLLTNRSELLP